MLSTLVAAWRNLVKRLSVDWLILTAGVVTILFALILLAAGPIYADAVTQSALRRALDAAAVDDTSIVVEVRSPPGDDYEAVDDIATQALSDVLPGVDSVVTRIVDGQTLELPFQDDEDTVALAQPRSMEDIANHADLVAGDWPDPALTPVQTAVSQSTADQLGLAVGDALVMTDRRDRDREVEFQVAGIYQPGNLTESFWQNEALVLNGVVESGGFRTFGPFIVAEAPLAAVSPRVNAEWRVHSDFDTIEIGETSRIQARLSALPGMLNDAIANLEGPPSRYSEFSVDSGLPRLLSGTGRSLTVTRSSVLALLIQLAILAGYALALTAGLLVETRTTETSLIRARGASPAQVVAVAGFEALLLTMPAALIAPWLAARTLDALVSFGPLAPVGQSVASTVTPESRLIVFVAAVAAILALVWPAWRSARSLTGSDGHRGRQRPRSRAQRAGVDIALVGLAVLAFWQLQSLGTRVSSVVQGRFGIDPVLIAAPALGLLAGSVLALRVVPLLARFAERIAAAGRTSVPALAAWQVARRPLRYARAALLLTMAVAIGFFAATYSTTWIDSQRDQADFQVGADLRVQPDRRTGASVTDLHLVATHSSTSGVARSMPVTRLRGTLPGSSTSGEILLLDAAAAAEVVVLRDDLDNDFTGLMNSLRDGRPDPPGIEVPGKPRKLGIVIEAVEDEAVDPTHGEILAPVFNAEARVLVQDAHGLVHRVALGPIVADQGRQTLEASLVADGPDGTSLTPAYPIRIAAVEITSRYSGFVNRHVTFDVIEFLAEETPGAWLDLDADLNPDAWAPSWQSLGSVLEGPTITESDVQPDHALRLEIDTGVGHGVAEMTSAAAPWPNPSTYPVVVTRQWLEASGWSVGDEMIVDALSTGRTRAVISGVIDAFPTTDPTAGNVMLVDLPTYQVLRYGPATPITPVGEHWLATNIDAGQVTESLVGQPVRARDVVGRAERFLVLSTDPVALGTIGALSIGFIAAAVFAAVGFAVSATVSARERITEFALLRAVGLSPRQLGRWMTLEQGTLVFSSLVFGTLVGWLLTVVILPLVTVTQEGTRPFPDVTIAYPWDALFLLEAGLVVVLAVIVVAMSILLRRLGLGSLLRIGEDR